MAEKYKATTRKRKACTQLRALASELGVPRAGRNADMKRTEFQSLLSSVVEQCRTPDQRERAEDARKLYDDEMPVANPDAVVPLPAFPAVAAQPQVVAAGSSASSRLTDLSLPLISGAGASSSATPQRPSVQVGAHTSQPAETQEFRLRGTSCLFTYNSPLFALASTEDLWDGFLAFIVSLPFVSRWTATMEKSLHSQDEGRVHLHIFVEFVRAVDWTSLSLMLFRGSRPDATPTRARGADQREAINQGHFYVWAWKDETVYVKTSGWEPWVHYAVKGWWIDSLWTARKLSHALYLDYAARVRVGFVNRQKQVDAIVERGRAAKLRSKQEAIALRLVPLCNQFKQDVLDTLAPWRAQYRQDALRYKFLVLRGGPRAGKSTLAKALGQIFGCGRVFVQTVQSAVAPDLKLFSNEEHGYILFDNVNDVEFVLSQRALFQGNNGMHTLGDSKTGIYAYQVWLCAVPIVVTVDLSARWNPSEAWISANCFDVFLSGPCYC